MGEPPKAAATRSPARQGPPPEFARAVELLRRREFDRAAGIVAELARRFPGAPPVLLLEGHLALARSERDRARSKYKAALAAEPRLVPAHINLGLLLAETGDVDGALRHLRRAQELQPDNPEILNNLGAVERQRSLPNAIAAFRRALQLRPDDRQALRNLGLALLDSGAAGEAETCFRRMLELAPEDIDARLELGRALMASDRLAEAGACFAEAARREPGRADAQLSLARLARLRGRREESLQYFRAALAAEPGNVFALARLLEAGAATPAELALATSEAGSAKRSPRDRAVLHFALYRHADAHSGAEAFALLATANRLRYEERLAQGRGYDRGAQRRFVERSERVCDAAWLRRTAGFAASDAAPIFILGMPRSGTTLCEEILSRHPRVRACGERPELGVLAQALASETGTSFPDCLEGLSAARARRAALDYQAALSGDDRVTTDKLPTNFLQLGLILALFPHARIVHCRRDPMDVGFSCFERNFDQAYPWSWDLAEIGHFLACHDRLMRHWQTASPVASLDWPYEALVGDPEARTRELLAFCGLDWHAGCLDFAGSDRLVESASTEQVRRPIYATSIGRWRRYEEELAPLAAAYAAARAGLGLER